MTKPKILLALVIVLLFIGGTIAGLANTIEWEGYAPVIRTEIANRTGVEVSYAGEPVVKLLPWPHLVFQFVEATVPFRPRGAITSSTMDTPFIEADVAHVFFNPIAWFRGEAYVHVHLISPTVVVERSDDGRYSIDRVLSEVAERAVLLSRGAPRSDRMILPLLARIESVNGRFTFRQYGRETGEETVKEATISDGRVALNLDEARLHARSESTRYTNGQYEHDLTLSATSGDVRRVAVEGLVSRLTRLTRSTSTRVKGVITLYPNIDYNLDLDALEAYLPL